MERKMKRTLVAEIASRIEAINNCRNCGNNEWEGRHTERLRWLERNQLPNGSDIDCRTKILDDECTPEKVVLFVEYHHMNGNGYYDGWTEHKITIRPSFTGIAMKIGGRDRNGIKDDLYEVYDVAMTEEPLEKKESK